MTATPKIGLFGGTFDPVHLGHLHMAGLAHDALALDEVRFMPCPISPHKLGSPPVSGEDRCEMLRLATADLPWAVVDDFELRQASPAYSYLTAEALAVKFPAARMYWIMGGDQWDALPAWKNPERLARCVEFAVIARGEPPQPRDGYRLHVVRGHHPASATAIRQALANGAMSHDWLAPNVAAWIAAKELYQS